MSFHRASLSILSCVIAALLVSGTAMPSSWLWECRHGKSVVAAPIAPTSAAMPCQMAGAMANMPCCRMRIAGAGRNSHVPRLQSSPCRPDFVKVAALPEGSLSKPSPLQTRSLVQDAPANIEAKVSYVAGPAMETSRQRPPPFDFLPSSSSVPLPGLRAPPASLGVAS